MIKRKPILIFLDRTGKFLAAYSAKPTYTAIIQLSEPETEYEVIFYVEEESK